MTRTNRAMLICVDENNNTIEEVIQHDTLSLPEKVEKFLTKSISFHDFKLDTEVEQVAKSPRAKTDLKQKKFLEFLIHDGLAVGVRRHRQAMCDALPTLYLDRIRLLDNKIKERR